MNRFIGDIARNGPAIWGALLAVPLASAALPQTCERVSGPNTVALLELYSSEGCNSCPPADRFISEVVTHGPGAERIVPIVLHVDYWDYIGWKDRFASPVFTARQTWLAGKNGTPRSIYTPEVFLSGREWRGWRGGDLAGALNAIGARPAPARIKLSISEALGEANTVRVEASVTPQRSGGTFEFFVALVQNAVTSAVSAGENRGVTLRHDAVVRQWAGPFSATASVVFDRQSLRTGNEAGNETPAGKIRVVAFAQNPQTGEVVQALAVPLPCGG